MAYCAVGEKIRTHPMEGYGSPRRREGGGGEGLKSEANLEFPWGEGEGTAHSESNVHHFEAIQK